MTVLFIDCHLFLFVVYIRRPQRRQAANKDTNLRKALIFYFKKKKKFKEKEKCDRIGICVTKCRNFKIYR